jgi:ERCC4-related helicase
VDVFAAALRGNTIAVLDTGTGKTMVAIMLAREHVRCVRVGEAPRRVVVFLAPTVHLVHQVRPFFVFPSRNVEMTTVSDRVAVSFLCFSCSNSG